MIPNFPLFIKLKPDIHTELKELTSKFPPYSDHNFTSILMWDIAGQTEFSILNGNLVIKFKDYESDKRFYSFIGKTQVENTIDKLIELSREEGLGTSLLLLPEDNFSEPVLKKLSSKYSITEDRDNHDYLLSAESLASFSGGKFLNKRNKLNKFKTYNPHVVIKDLSDPDFIQELKECVNTWIENTIKNRGESFVNQKEIEAFNHILLNKEFVNIVVFAVYIEDKLRGFSFVEIIDNDYAHHPFQKADISFNGIYEFLYNSIGKFLKEKGVKYLNVYQDMGHDGLRKAKLDYNPQFLKKYSISSLRIDKPQ